ncbi:MAG: glycosyltransferase family 2 protein [Proteobacteria bacterium]|nr:glycosyltransferase family 2 protein [Pseudomonadota bacterium]
MDTLDLSVVILAHDEARSVPAVLRELRTWLSAHEPDSEIVFVDDGSSDGSGELADQALAGFAARSVRHDRRCGMGAGLKTGVAAARGEWVTFLPADGQIAPQAIGTLRQAAAAEKADVVLSAYASRDDGLVRKSLSLGVRTLITLLHGVRLKSDGPYLFRRALFLPQQLASDTFFLNFEFPIRALRAGLRVSWVTIECRPRLHGKSKSASWQRALEVGSELVSMRVRLARDAFRRARGHPP